MTVGVVYFLFFSLLCPLFHTQITKVKLLSLCACNVFSYPQWPELLPCFFYCTHILTLGGLEHGGS